MQGQAPGLTDDLQERLPPALNWCLAGGGAAAGWYYARTAATPIPRSYIVGGAAAGYWLIAGLFAGLRLLKLLAGVAVMLVVLNYAILVPFNCGDRMPGWVADGKAALRLLNPAPLIGRWGKDVELRPSDR